MKRCAHTELYVDCSPAAAENGFTRLPADKRVAATTASGRRTNETLAVKEETIKNPWSFPGPLVLPDDDLALDPEYPPQSVRSWLSYNKKMPVRPERKAVYVVEPPEVMSNVRSLVKGWERPVVPKESMMSGVPDGITPPKTDDICDYLRAFYHGMDIKKHDGIFRWQAWNSEPSKNGSKRGPKYIGLATPAPSEELIGVRYRPSLDGIAKMQLNLNDMLDALIDRVPPDAYAIVILTDYDLYEDDEDDFCCGRAYGESRIAVVSSFRYSPLLDAYSELDLGHMWPASHCKRYVDALCNHEDHSSKKRKRPEGSFTTPTRSLVEATKAFQRVPNAKTRDELSSLWMSRVARTASHELGHCLGMDHCVYYACVMQGTAGMGEDVRQPPYLCPVCLSKLSRALCLLGRSGVLVDMQREYIKQRYGAMRDFCRNWMHVSMFAAYHAWIEKRLEEDEPAHAN